MGALFIFACLSPFLIGALLISAFLFENRLPLPLRVGIYLFSGWMTGKKTMEVNGWVVPFNYNNLYNEVQNEQVADGKRLDQQLG